MMKAVVFDLDGTLYDSKRLPLHLIFGDLRHALILKSERKARKLMAGQYFGTPSAVYARLFELIAQYRGCSAGEAQTWYDVFYMPLMAKVLSRHYEARPGLEALIQSFHQRGIQVAVFSDYGCVDEKLRALKIDPEWFDYIVDAPTVGGLKPSKQAFENVASLLGLPCKSILMVGDREDRDGAGARAAGMDFIRILNPGKKGEGMSWDAFVAKMM